MLKRIVVRVLPLWQGLEEAAPLAERIDVAQGAAAAAKVGLSSTGLKNGGGSVACGGYDRSNGVDRLSNGNIAATVLKLMEIGSQKTQEGTGDGPTLADSPWEVRVHEGYSLTLEGYRYD
jgi:hypothetical protein